MNAAFKKVLARRQSRHHDIRPMNNPSRGNMVIRIQESALTLGDGVGRTSGIIRPRDKAISKSSDLCEGMDLAPFIGSYNLVSFVNFEHVGIEIPQWITRWEKRGICSYRSAWANAHALYVASRYVPKDGVKSVRIALIQNHYLCFSCHHCGRQDYGRHKKCQPESCRNTQFHQLHCWDCFIFPFH